MRLHPTLIILATALTLPLPTLGSETDLTIADAYVRLVPPGTPNTAAFMTISNSGSSDRKLIQAESPVARNAELHTHLNDQGMMRMRQVADIEIKAGAQTELKPGGYHVMLLDLQQPLKEGDSVALTLRFDDGSTKEIDAAVKKPQTAMKAPTPATHGAMKY
ncbi:MAG: copper chaperone PCu(A)C [Candidatus Accumulibacter meliphilus]|uniref:Copper chaperone PCu(A)C n=1 Tax=Candidatus Accumulibacter meliphilus TaxID=2211374 RepID=A0A369XH51_9PROT|nr:MAG: copper chaperone PCu(A)C [Candidatus Accumulibacter meliphilus]